MARWTEPRWPGRCDSLRGFHLFRPAALRSSPDNHSGIIRPRRLALGIAGHHSHARRPVSGRASFARAFSTARDLAGVGVCLVAMAHSARVCEGGRARRVAVLWRAWSEPASARDHESAPSRLAQNSVWISRHLLRDISRTRHCVLSP